MHNLHLPIDDNLNLVTMQSNEASSGDFEDDRERILGANPEVVVKVRGTNEHSSQASLERSIASVFVLFLVNLLNYMDRFTIAGVLPKIKDYYGDLSNESAGLLQTSFIIFYMVFSPIFGFLGDRCNRTILMSLGIVAWSAVTLAGSFVPANMYWLFVLMRGFVGIGEASYSTIAPTIIADLFKGNNRTKALTLFYFAIPVGSGLGYIVGSNVAKLFGQWQFALRFTPVLGLICSALIFFVIKEPERGGSEGVDLHNELSCSSWLNDLKFLFKNKSYMLSTGGFTCVAFVAGALSFWAPTFMHYASSVYFNGESLSSISLKFGLITVLAGLIGVFSGTCAAAFLRQRYERADPLVCAFGLLMCAPFLFFSLVLSSYNITLTWILIFIGSTMLCLNWAIATDILLYVVTPTRRSTAEAFQILMGHTLGDAGSPYLVGLVSDHIKGGNDSDFLNFYSLQYAMYMMAFVAVIGGGFYLSTALFIVDDREKASEAIKEAQADTNEQENPIEDYTHVQIETTVPT